MQTYYILRFFKELRCHNLTCLDDDLYEASGETKGGMWIEARGKTPQEAIQWVVHYLDNPIEYEELKAKVLNAYDLSRCDHTF